MPATQLAVVYPGRFQPFHRGHFETWRQLVARFGPERVWIASAERAEGRPGRPAPLSFEERRRIAVTLFGLPEARFVRVRSPYAPAEILSGLDPEDTALVAAVGARDPGRLKSRYWAPFPPEGPWEPYPGRGYVLETPLQADDLSASAIRALLGSPRPRAEKEAALHAWYPRVDAELFELLLTRLGSG